MAMQAIDLIAARVHQEVINRAGNSWQDFVEADGSVSIDEESILFTALETVLGKPQYDAEFEMIAEAVEPMITDVWVDVRVIVREEAEGWKEWQRAQQSPEAMLRYHGMSIHDFI